MAGIYIHIPFCKQICHYCDFYHTTASNKISDVINAICVELRNRDEYLSGESVNTLYIGGGTPSVCDASDISKIINTVKDIFGSETFEEFTLEANPDDITPPYIDALLKIGVNRLSMGVQSFHDEDLLFMNRRHTAKIATEAVKIAQRCGFKNITIDLIYGVQGMSDNKWRENIDTAISLDIQHISAYALTIEGKSVFNNRLKRGLMTPVDEQIFESHYNILEQMTNDAGFEHYEVSNFAKKGFRAIHNSNYWKGIHYLGAGPSAHSFNGESRRWNVSSIEKYLENGKIGDFFETEKLSQIDMYNEYIMTSLRTSDGVSQETIKQRYSSKTLSYMLSQAEPFIKDGSLKSEGDRIFIPSSNFLISDNIISSLFIVED